MRRYLRASAVAAPLLLFGGFLLFAVGQVLVAVVVSLAAFFLFLAFSFGFSAGGQQQEAPEDSDMGVLRWVRRAAKYGILLWFLFQPEVESFHRRMTEGAALWDWRLIAPVGVLAIYSGISGLRRASRVTDTAIYTYFASSDGDELSK